MTTYKGIAAVTQTLGYLVGAAARGAVPEVSVTLARPEEPAAGAANDPRLNVYLVQVTPEATMRNNDLPTRAARGNLVAVPQAPVNLRYLLSFFGSSEKAHLMLGAAELVLREHAVLDPTLISQALASHPELQDSELEQQQPPVRIVPSTVSLEDLSRFWSGFLQMPYTVSTVYEAMTVVLTSSQTAAATLPVLRVAGRRGGDSPAQLDPLPTVQFRSRAPGTIVPVSGRGLAGDQHVQVSGRWLALEPDPTGGFRFTLPADAVAGPQSVHLGAAAAAGGGPQPIPGSEPQTLRVRPELRAARARRTSTGATAATVTVAPGVRPGQRATLSLVSTDAAAAGVAASAQVVDTLTALSAQLTFSLPSGLPPGRYLALLDIDGVTSLPGLQHGRFARPTLELAP